MAEILPNSVTSVKDGVEAAKSALELYNKAIITIIPWETFKEHMKELEESKKQYSDKAAEIVGKAQTFLLNSQDSYSSASLEIYRWCRSSAPLLQNCVELFAKMKETNVAEAQRHIIVKVLDDGEKRMKNAMDQLKKSRESFNDAYGQFYTLHAVLENDFREGSLYHTNAIDDVRKKAYGGAVAGIVFFGPIGLAISYSIAAGVVEGKLIPDLQKAFKETHDMFNNLQDTISETMETIKTAKSDITSKIFVINKVRSQIAETKNFAEIWAMIPNIMFDQLKGSIDTLIDMCNMFVKAEDDKNK